MNTLVVFLISMIFLLTVLIKFKWSASVGLVLATILMGLLSGMQVGELTGFISGGFGNTMTSTGCCPIRMIMPVWRSRVFGTFFRSIKSRSVQRATWAFPSG